MKTAKIISVIIIIGIIGCYSAIKAQEDTTLPTKPEIKSPPANTTPIPPSPETMPSPITPTLSTNQGLKIGVVNVVEVFDKYNKTRDYFTLLGKEQARLTLAIQEIEKEMKKLVEELDMLDKTSDLCREKKEQLSTLDAKRKYKVENGNIYLKNKNNEIFLKLYKDVRDAIDSYALENGYTFIFKSDPQLPATPTPETEDVLQQISVRTVLYSAKSTDITGDIIKILNKEK